MILSFKNMFHLFIFLQLWGSLHLLFYNRSALGKNLNLPHREFAHGEDTEKKATEEEIKYFFPGGSYSIYITNLTDYEGNDDYITPEDIESMNIVNSKGNLVDAKDIFETVETENGLMFKRKKNIEGYKLIKESYKPGYTSQSYCINATPQPENLILDNNFIVRLYDKNDRIISEYRLRDYTALDSSTTRNKIKSQGSTEANWLYGILELPPKDQKEGLKYRVVRLDSRGKPKLYLWDLNLGKPYQYYLWEESLPPYSEYKNWEYSEESGCYVKSKKIMSDQIIVE